ncbi:MAG: branched-chain amino acid aminotransferase [Bacilli bacterium]
MAVDNLITTTISKTGRPRPQDESQLGFSKYFSDHMFLMNYNARDGWHNPRIEPYAPLQFDPASLVFHYGQAIFEGLKAYRTGDGRTQLFRPEQNLKRLNRSADRLCIPAFPEDVVLAGLLELLDVDRDWIPSAPGTSLYIRPVIIATEPTLGVVAATEYLLFIVCSPVGSYYANGMKPVRIYVENEYVRAVSGGTGEAKTAGNYAASLRAGRDAVARGYDQVLWLDGRERKYIEEVGAMNMFFVLDNTLVTPPLSGSILPGITRDSILTLAHDRGLHVEERLITIDELVAALIDGRLREAFGSGTAAVVSAVGLFHYDGVDYPVGDGEIGPVTASFYETLSGIQYGTLEDKWGWTHQF